MLQWALEDGDFLQMFFSKEINEYLRDRKGNRLEILTGEI
jgi:hypothetical protein